MRRFVPPTGRSKERLIAAAVFLSGGLFYSAIAWRSAGAGQDPDSWRLAASGLTLWESGGYTPSRPPGFPVVELVAAVTAPLGLIGFKLMTAWAGAVCVGSTYLLAVRRWGRAALAAAGMLLACPAMILASTTTMDYVWSLAFMLLGLLLAQRGRASWCGLMIGLATGCRITALAALPVAWLLLRRGGWRPVRDTLALCATTLGVATALYGWVVASDPGILQQSAGRFFAPSIDQLWPAARALFGRVGAVAIALAVLWAIVNSLLRSRPAIFSKAGLGARLRLGGAATMRDSLAIAVMTGLFLLAYLVASYEAFYLLPVLPALFLLLAVRLGKTASLCLAAVLLLCNYRDLSSAGLTYGTVVQDIRDRDRTARLADWLLEHPPAPPALIIAGSRAPMLQYLSRSEGPRLPEGTRLGYYLRAPMVARERKAGERLYCLKDMVGACRVRGFDPIAAGAAVWWPPTQETDPVEVSGVSAAVGEGLAAAQDETAAD